MFRTKHLLVISTALLAIIFIASCEHDSPLIPDEAKTLDGPIDGLTSDEMIHHLDGDKIFNGKIFTKQSGLGPIFVAQSCGTCHKGDGKGHPSTMVTRFGQTDSTGNHFLNEGGPQLQNFSLPGYLPEQIPAGATFTKLIPPTTAGIGYLELVPDSLLLAMSDPDDLDGDGITGVPNWNFLPSFLTPDDDDVSVNGKYICRIGKKASVYNVLEQTAKALNQDIGIVSEYDPIDPFTHLTADAEISNDDIANIAFYLRTLKAPSQRLPDAPDVVHGKEIFIAIGCAGCHKETLKTGYSSCEVLSYKEFHPYTDLLLHDMGTGLDDGYTEGSAKTYEWRTPPLWGLGLQPNSQGGVYYLLHDGRAHSIREAIELHGGEALTRKINFDNLTETDKGAIIIFLESL